MSIATPALYVMIRTAISMQMEKAKGPAAPNSYSSQPYSPLPLLRASAPRQNPVFFWKGANILPRSLSYKHKHKPGFTICAVPDQVSSEHTSRNFFLSRFQEQLGPAVKCFALCTRYMNVNERHRLYFLTKQKKLGQANLECLHIP